MIFEEAAMLRTHNAIMIERVCQEQTDKRFEIGDKRSSPYKQGFFYALIAPTQEKENSHPLPWEPGMPELDAYIAGYQEGKERREPLIDCAITDYIDKQNAQLYCAALELKNAYNKQKRN